MLKVISSASPRISMPTGPALDEEDSLIVIKVSLWVCSWNVPGVSAVAMILNDSRGDTASDKAESCPILSHERYLLIKEVSIQSVSHPFQMELNLLSMMPFETKTFRARHAVRYPDLPHIVWLSARWVIVHNILNWERKHVSIYIAGQCGWFIGREDEHDRTRYVVGSFRGHPAVVIISFLVPLVASCLGNLAVPIVVLISSLSLLCLLVAFEGKRFDHGVELGTRRLRLVKAVESCNILRQRSSSMSYS